LSIRHFGPAWASRHLPAFLDQAADEFFIASTDHRMTGLDWIIEVTSNTVKLTYPVEDLVFDEK
jgi:hypothetical protein